MYIVLRPWLPEVAMMTSDHCNVAYAVHVRHWPSEKSNKKVRLSEALQLCLKRQGEKNRQAHAVE